MQTKANIVRNIDNKFWRNRKQATNYCQYSNYMLHIKEIQLYNDSNKYEMRQV